MKTLLKVAGAILACLVLLLVVLRITGVGPLGHTPGLWIKGNSVTTPVADWSFANKYQTLEIQTQTPYLLPHSVTTYFVVYQGQLYVSSSYPAGVKYPHGRTWNEDVARDPHVRIKIGSQLYNCMLVHVTDPALSAAVTQAKLARYPVLKIPPHGSNQVFHAVQIGAAEHASGN
ncbi:MAG TPA: hypothetical protein VNJ12_11535 [Candidatus Dormibacteraeota bacterium]|nr:hypothetical protein [Candidatus Dormibacteraeota bacterium]